MASWIDDEDGALIMKYATKRTVVRVWRIEGPLRHAACHSPVVRISMRKGIRLGGEAPAGLSQPPADPQHLGWWERCNRALRLVRLDLSRGKWKRCLIRSQGRSRERDRFVDQQGSSRMPMFMGPGRGTNSMIEDRIVAVVGHPCGIDLEHVQLCGFLASLQITYGEEGGAWAGLLCPKSENGRFTGSQHICEHLLPTWCLEAAIN